MTFKEQIENIAGPTVTSGFSENQDYNSRINSFLKQSARAVLDVLPDNVLIKDSIQEAIINNVGLDVTDKKIVKVNRAGYGCVEMPLEEKAHLEENSGSIKEPTKRSPVYYIEGQTSTGGKIFIKPNPTQEEQGAIDYNAYPTPLHSDESITNFPDIAEYAVIIGSALRLLQFKINELIHEDEDPEIAQVAQQEYLNVLGMYKDEIARLNGQLGMGGPSGNE